ncbi:haloacid dehalogenase type II [Alteromonas sp. C1M14]|uniref:haloacid dehalogenase type II n=1 Tax=Alteromonas sp. C1M14 TaxID=2841567 RepID=UPI001C0A2EBB|nr:haloacid dehalogenase type II [Alteromonas sp. C1M14]MBU2978586.1 haloacid dehalogenase type II [Alteromonas sp. C1M14]
MTPKTLIFDINETLLDMDEVKSAVADALGSDALVPLWFSTLLHYSLVETTCERFHDFSDIGAAAMVMVGHSQGIALDLNTARSHIVPAMTSIPPHDDVIKGLSQLKEAGFTLVALSNSSKSGLTKQLDNAKISTFFNYILSVESIRKYKPSPSVYHWACNQTEAKPDETMMVAAHGWDTSGAKAAGLQSAFVTRPGKMEYPLGIPADITVTDIQHLADILIR